MKDFFISFTRVDRSWAEWIAWELEAGGYSVVFQDWDFGAGSDFVLQMHKAAGETHRTIAVISPSYFASGYTQPEWSAAFAQDPAGENQKLVPIRVADFEPQGMFAARVFIDLVGISEVAARDRILDGVKIQRRKPLNQPIYPGARPAPVFPGTPNSLTDAAAEPDLTPALRDALQEQWKVCIREQLAVQTLHKMLTVHRVAPVYVHRVFGYHTESIVAWLRRQAEKQVLDPQRADEVVKPLDEDRTTIAAREHAVAAGASQVDVRHYLLAILDDRHSRAVAEIRKKIDASKPGGFAQMRSVAQSAPIDGALSTHISSLNLDADG